MDSRMSISGLRLRSRSQRYHSLGEVLGTRIQEHHDLIRRKSVCIQIVPIGRGIKGEMVFRRHRRKPSLGFTDKADMGRILFGGIERDHSKLWLIGAQASTAG